MRCKWIRKQTVYYKKKKRFQNKAHCVIKNIEGSSVLLILGYKSLRCVTNNNKVVLELYDLRFLKDLLKLLRYHKKLRLTGIILALDLDKLSDQNFSDHKIIDKLKKIYELSKLILPIYVIVNAYDKLRGLADLEPRFLPVCIKGSYQLEDFFYKLNKLRFQAMADMASQSKKQSIFMLPIEFKEVLPGLLCKLEKQLFKYHVKGVYFICAGMQKYYPNNIQANIKPYKLKNNNPKLFYGRCVAIVTLIAIMSFGWHIKRQQILLADKNRIEKRVFNHEPDVIYKKIKNRFLKEMVKKDLLDLFPDNVFFSLKGEALFYEFYMEKFWSRELLPDLKKELHRLKKDEQLSTTKEEQIILSVRDL